MSPDGHRECPVCRAQVRRADRQADKEVPAESTATLFGVQSGAAIAGPPSPLLPILPLPA